MKNFLIVCVMFAGILSASAQETGLVDIPAVNPEYLKDSKYVAFAKKASNVSLIRANFCGFLKLVSTSTLGGYNIFAVKMFDRVNNTSAGAMVVAPNSSSGVGGAATKVVGGLVKSASAGLLDVGGASQTFYIDEEELPMLIEKLNDIKKISSTTPDGFLTFTYVCQGGFTITAGYNVTLKKPIWLGTVGTTAEMPLGDFIDEMIVMFTKGKEALDKMNK